MSSRSLGQAVPGVVGTPAENGWRVPARGGQGAQDPAIDLISDSESEDSEEVSGSEQVGLLAVWWGSLACLFGSKLHATDPLKLGAPQQHKLLLVWGPFCAPAAVAAMPRVLDCALSQAGQTTAPVQLGPLINSIA
jgi:hypothetical protein